MKYPNEVQKVVDFITEVRNEFPDVTDDMLEKGGKIGYYNGNDGTDFDWSCNERLCEFGIGTADGDVYAFKCYVHKDGKADVYCYPHGEMRPIKEVEKDILTKSEVRNLYYTMLENADGKEKYNAYLEDIFKGVKHER